MIALVVYNNVQENRLESMQERFDEQRAVMVAEKIVSLPDLQCTNHNVATKNCFSIQKFTPFIQEVQDNAGYYREEFGRVKINVTLVYPVPAQRPAFFASQVNRNLVDFSAASEETTTFYFPLLLRDERFEVEQHYFGWLIVEAYT
tara:strand:- start:619 stop:1056 length:438 start_codon:yes stop_codon:yes gene_type:complete